MMGDGWSVTVNKNHLAIEKDQVKLIFNIIVTTQRGKLFCINIQRSGETCNAKMDIGKNKYHKMLGHSNGEVTIA